MKEDWVSVALIGILLFVTGYFLGAGGFPSAEIRPESEGFFPLAILGTVEESETTEGEEPTFIGSDNIETIEPVEDTKEAPEEKGEVKDFVLIVKKFKFVPDTITVNKGDTVRLNIASGDYKTSHTFVLPEYGIKEWVPAGRDRKEPLIVTFVADRAGIFEFSCDEYAHPEKGRLIVNK